MDPIRRPTRIFISALAMCQLIYLAAGDVHDEDIVVAGIEAARPGEGDVLAVGVPGGVDRFALSVGEAADVGAVHTHAIDLRKASAIGDEYHFRAGFGVYLRFDIDRPGVRNAAQAAAIDVDRVNLGGLTRGGG